MPWADNQGVLSEYFSVTWFPPPAEVADAIELADTLQLGGFEYEDGEQAHSPFTDIPLAPGQPFVRVYIPLARASLLETVQAVCQAHGWPWRQTTVASDDWANAWKAHYQPQLVGDKYAVVPAWYEDSPRDAVHTLWLDPGMAFGTGTHATTRMCLAELARMHVAGKRVLDLGAGSGILGLFACLREAAEVVLVEPDPVAVDALTHNARINGLEHAVKVVPGTLAALPPSSFDVLCLNIIWDIIHAEWSRVQHYLAPGAVVLLSGLLQEKQDIVRTMVEETGQTMDRVDEADGWILAVVRHGSSHA